MRGRRVLITGGAGFIGSHLSDHLLAQGAAVRVLDALCPQVHGPGRRRPAYLDPEVELVVGDCRDSAAVGRATRGVDAVVHLAAAVGVGQSMYEVSRYVAVNDLGTAVLLQALIANPVERLVVASSMSLYGEGLYRDTRGRLVQAERTRAQLVQRSWEPVDDEGAPLEPVPTPETKPPALASVYALSKFDQERMSLLVGAAYGMGVTALRFFNVYGTRQALSNPYTGVLAIFAARCLNGRRPLVNEDGRQRRDFVSVRDVAAACRLALEAPGARGEVFNVGSGRDFTVLEVAERLAGALGREDLPPEITQRYRVGDVRHCFADIGKARRVLGYEPRVTFEDGLEELAGWLEGQIAQDRVDEARLELTARGLSL
ncbi:MAG TPA: NAD-dependent epimerase/dehydratase family protein [Anaeromyxobacteraceae bacterium]|jgi:dTDP-L-rhamnose 4-epimerase|nr:NAD-dependent epimerase/dehydratase family protein [Anaeromyxobacteraceae bacterium]